MAFQIQKYQFLSEIHDICQSDDGDICVIQMNELVTILNVEKNAIRSEIDLQGKILERFQVHLLDQNKQQIYSLNAQYQILRIEEFPSQIKNYMFLKENGMKVPNFYKLVKLVKKIIQFYMEKNKKSVLVGYAIQFQKNILYL